jgi:hypothetical protein
MNNAEINLKMNTLNLREIAELNGLTYAESTSGNNGYPSGIKGIILGFETFEEAEELAEKHGLSIETFKKKDGWQLWERTGNKAYEPFKNSCDDYGDNYSQLEKMSEKVFFESEVKDSLENFDNLEDLQNFLSKKQNLFDEVEILEIDEIVITCQGEYYETIKKTSMIFSHDTKTIVIGLIYRNQ